MRDTSPGTHRFDQFFKLSFSIAGEGNGPGQFFGPSDIAEDPAGNLYVTDELNHRIQKFSGSGKYLDNFGSRGKNPGELKYPTALTISYKGDIIVTDRWNHRVQILDPNGKAPSAFGSYGKALGDFNEPWGISLSSNGNLFIADRGNHRIQVLGRDGKFLHAFGKTGFDRYYFESEDFKAGFVYECWKARISRFSTIETSLRAAGYEIGTLSFPRWLRHYGDNAFLVVETSGIIHLAESKGVFSGRIELDHSDNLGRFLPASAAATPNGTVLVCDECRSEIIAVIPELHEKTVLTDIPWPVSNLRWLPSGRLALVHCWNNAISILSIKQDI